MNQYNKKMKKTAEEILEVLNAKFPGEEAISEYAYGDFDNEDVGLGPIVEVYQYGGEGEGERWETVKHFVDHDVYIKTRGFYSSYNGTDFYYGIGEEVNPVEKTVTVYE